MNPRQLAGKHLCCSRFLPRTFKGDVRGSLDEFEVKIRRYERSCNKILSDRVKIAVVQKGIEDEDLRRHVLMHASRLSTYPLVREEIRSIIMAPRNPEWSNANGRHRRLQRQEGKREEQGQERRQGEGEGPRSEP